MTSTIKYRIAKPKNYTNAANEEKTFWDNVGTITVFMNEDGTKKNTMVEIPAIGLEAQAFLVKEKDEGEA